MNSIISFVHDIWIIHADNDALFMNQGLSNKRRLRNHTNDLIELKF